MCVQFAVVVENGIRSQRGSQMQDANDAARQRVLLRRNEEVRLQTRALRHDGLGEAVTRLSVIVKIMQELYELATRSRGNHFVASKVHHIVVGCGVRNPVVRQAVFSDSGNDFLILRRSLRQEFRPHKIRHLLALRHILQLRHRIFATEEPILIMREQLLREHLLIREAEVGITVHLVEHHRHAGRIP